MRLLRLLLVPLALTLVALVDARGQELERLEHYPDGSIGAMSRAHRLTWPELTQMFAAMRALERDSARLERGLFALGPASPLRESVATLAGMPVALHDITAAGMTPDSYLVVSDAFSEAVLTVMLQGITSAAPLRVPQENLDLLRAHRADVAANFSSALGTEAAATLGTALGAPVVPPPGAGSREVDSLSRLVPTDSLGRLYRRIVDAPDALLPSLGAEVACEVARLNWQYGSGPALAALRRMRETMNADQPGAYPRANQRLMATGALDAMSDARCGWSRLPRADARLDTGTPQPR